VEGGAVKPLGIIVLLVAGFAIGVISDDALIVQPLKADIAELEREAEYHAKLRRQGMDLWCRNAYENGLLQ
jgi:hypothetical protein